MQVTSSTTGQLTSLGLSSTTRATEKANDQRGSKNTPQSQPLDLYPPAVSISLSADALLRLSEVKASTVSDTGALSQEAQETVADPRVAYYQQFRATHEGFSSYNMTLGIVDPSAQPFSQNRPFAEVAQAARDSLDANAQKLKDIGKPYDFTYAKSEDVNSLFGELDRRALYAVSNNEGGLFTKNEQDQARSIMSGQQGMAMGLYNGPTELASKFSSLPVTNDDYARVFKAGITFLDNVPKEEKATDLLWAISRAGVQFSYEDVTQTKGSGQYDSDNPVVGLIKEAFDNAWRHEGSENMDAANVRTADELKSRTWFVAYADKYDAAAAEAREMYGVG